MENNLVTVLIPAHNRQNRLKRLVEYYSSAGIPIIIADSSDEEWEEANNLPSNVLYRYCCRMHLVDKVISVTGFIETPYVVMCADDDFITLKGISDCVKALKSAPADVNSAQGNYYRYFPMDNLRLEKIYTQMKGNSIVDDTSLKRVWHLADCYYQFYYAVYRRDFFIEAYMACLHNGEKLFQNLCIVELFLSFYSIIRGKHIVVDTNYAFREYIPDSAGTWVPNLYVVKNDPTCRVEAGNMEQALALMMSEEDNVSLQYARSEISNALDHYIGKFITPPIGRGGIMYLYLK